jgi:hypothetical protein
MFFFLFLLDDRRIREAQKHRYGSYGSGSATMITCTSRVYSRRGRPARGRRQPGAERVRGAKALEKESATTTAWITSSPRSSTFGPIYLIIFCKIKVSKL